MHNNPVTLTAHHMVEMRIVCESITSIERNHMEYNEYAFTCTAPLLYKCQQFFKNISKNECYLLYTAHSTPTNEMGRLKKKGYLSWSWGDGNTVK